MSLQSTTSSPPLGLGDWRATERSAALEERSATRWLLAGVILVACALRLFVALRFPYEQDELYTIIESAALLKSPLHPGIEARPLYYLLQHPLLTILPVNEAMLRLLPTIFGIVGVWVMYLLARGIAGTRAGVIAAVLTALAPWHLEASGTARYWSLIFLFAALSYNALLRAYESDSPRDFLLALLFIALGTLTHPTFVMPMVGFVLALTLVRNDGTVRWTWPTRRAWTYLWGPYAAVLAIFAVVLRALQKQGSLSNWGGRGLAATLRLVPAMIDSATPVIVTLATVGVVLLVRSSRSGARRVGVAIALGTLSCAALLTLAAMRTDTYATYALSAFPLVLLGASLGINELAESAPKHAVAVVVSMVLVTLAATTPALASHLRDAGRFDYRPAFDRIRHDAPTVAVATWPLVLQRHYAPDLRGIEMPQRASAMDALLEREGDLWAVVSVKRFGVAMDDTGELTDWLHKNCRVVSSYEHSRFDYRVYRVDLMRCTRGGSR